MRLCPVSRSNCRTLRHRLKSAASQCQSPHVSRHRQQPHISMHSNSTAAALKTSLPHKSLHESKHTVCSCSSVLQGTAVENNNLRAYAQASKVCIPSSIHPLLSYLNFRLKRFYRHIPYHRFPHAHRRFSVPKAKPPQRSGLRHTPLRLKRKD